MNNYVKICTKGHVVSCCSQTESSNIELCYCGAKLISRCPNCGAFIPAFNTTRITVNSSKYKKPNKCEICLCDFPWVKVKKKSIRKQKFLYYISKVSPQFILSVISKIIKS